MSFLTYYNKKRIEFVNQNLFTLISGEERPIKWPKSSGVYTIWKKHLGEDSLIYVGMTGKYSRNKEGKVVFNGASFKSRATRWTPYRFCEGKRDKEMKFHFRYGPLKSNTNEQGRIKYELNAYNNSIKYTNLEIHCFHINSEHTTYSPILLESEFLTKFLKTNGSLPPANNEL